MPRSNVVITGCGVVSSIGIGRDQFFRGLLEKMSGIVSLSKRTDGGATPGASRDPAGVWIGGPIVDFDAKQYVRPRKALKVMCREIQTGYAASQLAIDDAGLAECFPASAEGEVRPEDVGTVFGSEMFYGPPSEMEDAIRACIRADGSVDGSQFGNIAMKKVLPLWMLKYLPNMPACHVGIALGAHGPNNSLILGDISAHAAMIEAASCIERGIAKVMITGATGTRINTTRINYRGDLPIPEVVQPLAESSRPHDPTSKGVVGGEGAASMVLEHAENAAQRGAKPIARLVAYSSRFIPSPGMSTALRSPSIDRGPIRGSSAAIRGAIESVIEDAGISAGEIGLVMSHAMGDPVIDAAEREALRSTIRRAPLVATIASLGHTGAASGAIDLAVAAIALAEKTIPPTLCFDESRVDVPFLSAPRPLTAANVLCLSHTPEGAAIAAILRGS